MLPPQRSTSMLSQVLEQSGQQQSVPKQKKKQQSSLLQLSLSRQSHPTALRSLSEDAADDHPSDDVWKESAAVPVLKKCVAADSSKSAYGW